MAPPNISQAKRNGLVVDLDRLANEGDEWLTPEDRYALKTYGVCAQAQPGMFMIRVRIPGGQITPDQARGLADTATTYAGSWIHLTTRQNIEFHNVAAIDAPAVLAATETLGLTNRSACGHTMRNVMSCPDAGVGLDEPFDCLPDARMVSDAILARSAELNRTLPSRLNFAFGGCPRCAEHAHVNDLGFESRIVGDRCGYRLWAGGSLGTMPVLAMPLLDFIPRESALAAAEALIEVFIAHGDFENPKKARMKFLVEQMGEEEFRSAFMEAFRAAAARPQPPVAELDPVAKVDIDQVLRCVPDGGWGSGVRPQRVAGIAMVTVNVPLGDLDSDDLRVLADVAETTRDGYLNLTRNQNVQFRDVPIGRVGQVRKLLAARDLSLEGADGATDVRVCTGSAVCSLGITDSPSVGVRLIKSPALERNASLRVHISGCPNSCAQHQIGDIGLSGAKVRIGGETQLGYHVLLGSDVQAGKLAQVVGRVAEDGVEDALEAVIGSWEAIRLWGETLADTLERIGTDAFAAHLSSITDGFEPGDDPAAGEAEPLAVSVGT